MSEGDVVYSDVKFKASKEKSKGSQPEASGGRSKVTVKWLMLLCAVLAAAVIGLCFLSLDNIKTKKSLQALKDENDALRKHLTACETGWDQHGGSCYYFSTTKLTWIQSRDDCRGRGADLVQIDSEEEQCFLENRLRGNMNSDEDKFWIGLTDSEEEGKWLWVDGSTLNTSLSFWFCKEPDNWTGVNPAGEDCARMGEKGGAADLKCWFDKSCDAEQKRICEKAATTVKCVWNPVKAGSSGQNEEQCFAN